MKRSLRDFVVVRAENRCEYCHLAQADTEASLEIEHVIARKHHGTSDEDNLCLSCIACNQYKGSNIAGIDPESRQLVRLFHPRADDWDRHFRWSNGVLIGLTDVGRATIDVLRINGVDRVAGRQMDIPQQND